MVSVSRLLTAGIGFPALCFAASMLTTSAVTSLTTHAQTTSSSIFPDVPPNYWAQPFIQGLAERNIVTGYPDGTFRPKQNIERDEFAAIVRKAFEQPPERQIESGSVYKDVPRGYWAAPAIEQAYQQGFMSGYAGGYFLPREEVSKVDAIIALTQGLNLPIPPTTASTVTTVQPARRQAPRTRFLFPLAITSLMQPLMIPPARATTPQGTTTATQNLNRPVSAIVAEYYVDAEQIPQNAIPNVAAATLANIVVNYPNPRELNPNQPISRGETAALVYQTLVKQGKVDPIAINVPASKYIVSPNTNPKAQE